MAPLDHDHDNEAVQQEDEDKDKDKDDGDDGMTNASSPSATILLAIGKVMHRALTPLLIIVLIDFLLVAKDYSECSV